MPAEEPVMRAWRPPRPPIPIALSTASVYPQSVESGFALAAELGYDGVELMVWTDPVSQNVDAAARMSRRYGMPILAVHAPCLLITQRVWGSDPAARLDRAVDTAGFFGARSVVVHPPFRWQRRYARGFAEQVARLEQQSDIVVAVENMFPMRADRVLGAGRPAAQRLARRGVRPGGLSRRSRHPSTRPMPGTPTTPSTCPTRPLQAWTRSRWLSGWGTGSPTCI